MLADCWSGAKRPLLRLRGAAARLLAGVVIEERWLLQGIWFNLLITLGCVHSMAFTVFHMEAFLQRGLKASHVAAVHLPFMIWNPVNDIAAGYLADEWVSRGFGSRLSLLAWAHAGWAASTIMAFQEWLHIPVWLHYAAVIFTADGFGSLAGAVQSLVLIECTSEERQRIQIQRLNSVFGCGEWLVMAIAYSLWDARPGHGALFRAYLWVVCLGSLAFTLLAVRGLQRPAAAFLPVAAASKSTGTLALAECNREKPGCTGRLCPFLLTAAQHDNFRRYVTVCAVLEAETVFFRQFDVVLVRTMLISWSAASRVLLIVIDPLCGALAFLLTWVAERPEVGTYGVTWATLRMRLAVCFAAAGLLSTHSATAALVGASAPPPAEGPRAAFAPEPWLAASLGALMLLCRATTRPTVAFGGVVFASVIQEHALLEFERRGAAQGSEEFVETAVAGSGAEGVAGKYWMLRAAITKPLNSIGPILGTAVLASAGYSRSQKDEEPLAVDSRLWWTSATFPVAVSLAVSAVVLPAWGRFTLHGARLEKVVALTESHQRRAE